MTKRGSPDICEKGSRPLLFEELLISETCALEESASHHLISRNQDSERNMAVAHLQRLDSDPGVDIGVYVEHNFSQN